MYRKGVGRRTRDNAKREAGWCALIRLIYAKEGRQREEEMIKRDPCDPAVALFLLALFAVVAAFHFSCTS